MRHGPSEPDLRLRYYDWCSARIAEHFLRLSPAEVWERAQRAVGGVEAGSAEGLGAVRELTQALAAELALPSYEAWLEGYGCDPARYEREMLGFGNAEVAEEQAG